MSQTKTTTDQINYEYSLLKDIDLETVFEFCNSMNEFEPLSKEMFLEAWNRFNNQLEKRSEFDPEYIQEDGKETIPKVELHELGTFGFKDSRLDCDCKECNEWRRNNKKSFWDKIFNRN